MFLYMICFALIWPTMLTGIKNQLLFYVQMRVLEVGYFLVFKWILEADSVLKTSYLLFYVQMSFSDLHQILRSH